MSWSFSECYLMVVCQLVTVWDLLRWCEILTRLCRFSAKVAWKALCSLTATHSTSGSKTRTKEKCESVVLFFLRQFKVLLDESFNGCVHFSETRENMYLFWGKKYAHLLKYLMKFCLWMIRITSVLVKPYIPNFIHPILGI